MKKKYIQINTYQEYKKFLKKIKIYKSVFYQHILFVTDSKIPNVEKICTALNIKKRFKRVQYIYDEVCAILDFFMSTRNICDFKENKCFVQRKTGNEHYNGCCGPISCKYIINGHCTTQNISCKFFYCPEAKKKNKLLHIKDIDLLKVFSLRQKIIIRLDVTSNREQILKDLSSYSFLWAIANIMFRNYRIMK